jgi:diguanylate cyclase (GGDEF)-like protein/PAS domain S-box-containing protein
MTRFESRPLPDAVFEPPVPPTSRRRAAPVPTLEVPGPRGNGDSPALPRFRTVAEPDFDVVVVLDADGRFRFVSASAERLLGYPVDDAIGTDAFALLDSFSVDPVRALFDDLVARRRLTISLEMQTLRADGVPVDLELFAVNHLEDPMGGIVVSLRDVTERNRLTARIHEVDEIQSVVIDSLADGVALVDADGTIRRVNESFEIMFEAPRIRAVGRRLADVLAASPERGVEVFDAAGEPVLPGDDPLDACLRSGRRLVGVVLGVRRNGGPVMWVRLGAQAVRAADGTITGAVVSAMDVTAVRSATTELHRSEQFLQVLLDTLDEGIIACDAEGSITVFNPAARRLHGLAPDDEPLGALPSTGPLRWPDGTELDAAENPLLQAMSGRTLRDLEVLLEAEDGVVREVSVNGEALVDEEGFLLGAVVAMHDVTEQKRNEERLAVLAMHDPLTGLANRTLLAARLQEAIDNLASRPPSEAGVGRGPGVAVFLLDLDEFKEVNDVLGHDVGDDMLVAVARRLLSIVRPSDTVARLGGDEFVVVCDVENGEEEMLRIADRISTALARPYRIDGRTLGVLASVGGVFADNPDTDPSRLLSRADDAMYGVKWSRRRERRSMTD